MMDAALQRPVRAIPDPELPPPRRREEREQVVRLVEYTAFPRVSPHQRERVGFTRDLSPSGMCLRVEAPEEVGSLLRVAISGANGLPTRESVARVAWCQATADGAFWLGLAVLEHGREARMHDGHETRIEWVPLLRDCA
jgi:hypothetical protein